MAFDQLEPFGGPIDDLRAGLGPAVKVNSYLPKGNKPTSPLDFYPWHREEEDHEVFVGTPEERAKRIGDLLLSLAPKEPRTARKPKASNGRKHAL